MPCAERHDDVRYIQSLERVNPAFPTFLCMQPSQGMFLVRFASLAERSALHRNGTTLDLQHDSVKSLLIHSIGAIQNMMETAGSNRVDKKMPNCSLELARKTMGRSESGTTISISPTGSVKNVRTLKLAGFTPTALVEDNSDGSSNFNSLQVTLTKHYGNGLQFFASYTFSKTLDTNGVNTVEAGGGTSGDTIGNNLRPRGDYGRTNFDRPHRFVISYLFELLDLKNGSQRGARSSTSGSSLE